MGCGGFWHSAVARPAPGPWCWARAWGPSVVLWAVCPAQVWDPSASLGRLVCFEPPDSRVNKVVRGLCHGGDERLELSHKDFGCCGVWQGDHGEEPARVDVLEVFQEGCH